jgi:hypothetical protein
MRLTNKRIKFLKAANRTIAFVLETNFKKFAGSAWFFRLLRQHNAGICKMTPERQIS